MSLFKRFYTDKDINREAFERISRLEKKMRELEWNSVIAVSKQIGERGDMVYGLSPSPFYDEPLNKVVLKILKYLNLKLVYKGPKTETVVLEEDI